MAEIRKKGGHHHKPFESKMGLALENSGESVFLEKHVPVQLPEKTLLVHRLANRFTIH